MLQIRTISHFIQFLCRILFPFKFAGFKRSSPQENAQSYETSGLMQYKQLLILCTLVLLTSCGKGGEKEDRSVFEMNLSAGLSTLDPAHARDQSAGWMVGQLFNGLVSLDENMEIAPAVADYYEFVDSTLTYIFHLRDDVQFHRDGAFGPDSTRTVSADDFMYSFHRIVSPETASSGAWIFSKVAGYEDFRSGNAASIAGFQVVNDSTFSIQLAEPFPPMLGLLTMPYASVVPKEVVEALGNNFRTNPIGTGPFRFKSWKDGVSLILLKNEDYFEVDNGQQLPFLDAVRVRFIRSRLSEFVEFCQGKLDFINSMDESFKDEVFDMRGDIRVEYAMKYNFDQSPQLNTEFLGILVEDSMEIMNSSPFADVRFRKALNYALDKEKLVKYVLKDNGFPATAGIIPPGTPGYSAEKVIGYPYDWQKAAELLTAAGYPGGKGLPVISLKSNPNYKAVMEFVQKSWERLGITVEIDDMNGSTLRELASKGEINLWRASWIADYPEGENYLSLFYSGNIPPNGPNRMRYANATFDSLYRASQRVSNDSARFEIYHQMENLIMAEAPVIPLYYDKILRIIQRNISGFKTNAMNMLFLKEVRKGIVE